MSVTVMNGLTGQNQQTQTRGNEVDGIASLEANIQGLLESLLELGVCTTEVHPSAVETSPNGNGNGNGSSNNEVNEHNGTNGQYLNDRREQEDGDGAFFPSYSSQTNSGPWTGYKHSGGLVGQKVQDAIKAMQSVFNSHNTTNPHNNNNNARELYVPHEVIDYVDQGRNPEIYTRELLDRLSGENMYTNGILDAVASYQSLLASEMKIAFPDLRELIDDLGISSPGASPQDQSSRPSS